APENRRRLPAHPRRNRLGTQDSRAASVRPRSGGADVVGQAFQPDCAAAASVRTETQPRHAPPNHGIQRIGNLVSELLAEHTAVSLERLTYITRSAAHVYLRPVLNSLYSSSVGR